MEEAANMKIQFILYNSNVGQSADLEEKDYIDLYT
jgi:hypothetical protein